MTHAFASFFTCPGSQGGRTPLYFAQSDGHAEAVALLQGNMGVPDIIDVARSVPVRFGDLGTTTMASEEA